MGRGLGPTQQKVLELLRPHWETVDKWGQPGEASIQGVVDCLATTYSEAQAVRRAIRTLRDRGLIEAATGEGEEHWLVKPGRYQDGGLPRVRREGKLAALRAAILQHLSTDWQPVLPIRCAVIGEGSDYKADRQRVRFNRALRELVRSGQAVSIGVERGSSDLSGWQVRLLTDQEREQLAPFIPQ